MKNIKKKKRIGSLIYFELDSKICFKIFQIDVLNAKYKTCLFLFSRFLFYFIQNNTDLAEEKIKKLK